VDEKGSGKKGWTALVEVDTRSTRRSKYNVASTTNNATTVLFVTVCIVATSFDHQRTWSENLALIFDAFRLWNTSQMG
jgi:hypothetical protein